MDDIQLYIYLALALIYFLVRALRPKNTNQSEQDLPESWPKNKKTPRIPEKDRSMTFEDLLKEYTGSQEEPSATTESESEEVEIAQPEEEYKSYEGYNDYKKGSYVDYDDLVEESGNLKTLDEQVKIEDTVKSHASGYEIEETDSIRAHHFRQMLMNRNSLQEAIILKEILEPKHF